MAGVIIDLVDGVADAVDARKGTSSSFSSHSTVAKAFRLSSFAKQRKSRRAIKTSSRNIRAPFVSSNQYAFQLAYGGWQIYPPYEYSREAQSRTTFRGFAPLGPGREARHNDIFFQYGIDPRREAHNEALMSYFMTRLGKIKPRSVTGLSQRSQRLVGKAIKRAKMMGVVPMFSNSKMDKMIARTNGAIYEESPPERVEKEDGKPDADVKEDDKK